MRRTGLLVPRIRRLPSGSRLTEVGRRVGLDPTSRFSRPGSRRPVCEGGGSTGSTTRCTASLSSSARLGCAPESPLNAKYPPHPKTTAVRQKTDTHRFFESSIVLLPSRPEQIVRSPDMPVSARTSSPKESRFFQRSTTGHQRLDLLQCGGGVSIHRASFDPRVPTATGPHAHALH